MKLMVYNTMTRQKEVFEPLEKQKVGIYTCGPTVYNYIHIGNARMAVFFDVVRRFFLSKDYDVRFVQNVTDVDDRIIQSAKESGQSEVDISRHFTDAYNTDLAQLNVLAPDIQPKVTEHIPPIISFIQTLLDKGYAYEKNGDVYYRVERFADYGKLTNQTLEQLQHTERKGVDIIPYKENPHDFALWKKQKDEEIAWNSPWGKGRPGWHIECSAMSTAYLGDTFDIHGGGLDLCFPHHENEIAQSEAYSGKPFASYWMHNNYVTVDGHKMSKSTGNFTTVRDALQSFSGETLRYFFLSVNYRNPIDYSEKALLQASVNLKKVQTTFRNLSFLANDTHTLSLQHPVRQNIIEYVQEAMIAFDRAMYNDFDTANALETVLSYTKQVNLLMEENRLSESEISLMLPFYQHIGRILGFSFEKDNTLEESILHQIQTRADLKELAMKMTDKAERSRLFAASDKIREDLLSQGIILEDTPNGTRWKRKHL